MSPSPVHRRAVVLSGLGHVGAGLLVLLRDRAEDLRTRHGVAFTVVGAVDSRGAAVDPAGLHLDAVLAAKGGGGTVAGLPGSGRAGATVPEVLAELGEHAQVLVEAGPAQLRDGGPGLVGVLDARRRDLDVVLASKAPLVVAWEAVTSGAESRGRVRYSGCVGGALPTIDLLRGILASASTLRVETSLNATCQLVLRLMETGTGLADAVAEAQRRGVAEPDPSLDVDGWDPALKIAVIANAVLDRPTSLSDVEVTGIRDLDPAGLLAARERGEVVVMLGLAERASRSSNWQLSVRPTPLPLDHPLARMTQDEAGFVVHTDVAGRLSATSLETDALPTAAAVLRDLVDLTVPARR